MSLPSPWGFVVFLLTLTGSREELCLPSFDVVNCSLNRLSICFGENTWEQLKVMASFSTVCFDLPSSALIIRHSLQEADLWSKVSTNVHHLPCLCLFFAWLISSFICDRAGEVSRSSCVLIMSTMSAGRASVWSILCLPEGMCCDPAFKMAACSIFLSLLAISWVRLCAQFLLDVLAVSFPVRLFKVHIVLMKRRGRGECHLQTNEDW